MTVDPAFDPLSRRPASAGRSRFDYRTPEDDAAAARRLQPWGVVSWRGRWYVVGHDLDRDATRCFRLVPLRRPGHGGRRARALPAAGRPRPDQPCGPVVRTGRAPGPGHGPATSGPRPPGSAGSPRRSCPDRRRPGGAALLRPGLIGPLAGRLRRRPDRCWAPTRCARRPSPGCATPRSTATLLAAGRRLRTRAGAGEHSEVGLAERRGRDRLAPAAQPGALPAGPARHPGRGGRRRPGGLRPAAARGPRAAVGLRAARLRSGRPDRHGLRRRPRDDHLRRGHRPAATADPGRGVGAGRGAADAGRGARAHDRDAVERALAKIESAAGDAADELAVAAVRRPRPRPMAADRLAELQGAVQRRRALRITYYTATRDEVTERVVDPMRVLVAEAGPTWRRGAAGSRRSACSASTGSTRATSSTSRLRRHRTPSRTT